MMKILVALFLFSNLTVTTAFQPISRSTVKRTALAANSGPSDANRIKKAGCGVPTIPAGNCLLFDPEEQGKLQGSGQLSSRIHDAYKYIIPEDATFVETVETPPEGAVVLDAQHWLEHLSEDLPLNFAKPNAPVEATVLGRMKVISEDAPGDIQHIIMRLPEGMHYVEGQSLSVIPPGTDPKTNKKYAPRLYSIASTRYGDVLDGNTISLCVRRAEYYDPETGKVDPSKKGVCSNYLCDAVPGMKVNVAGPVGKTMLLPKNPNDDVIMIATGTGIAPFRGFMHRLFMENTVARHVYGGVAWLVLGVPTSGGLLYKDEFDAMLKNGKFWFYHKKNRNEIEVHNLRTQLILSNINQIMNSKQLTQDNSKSTMQSHVK